MCEICRQYRCPAGCPNAPDPPAVVACEYCGENIVVGDEYFEYNGNYYHVECFADAAVSLLLENGASHGEMDYDDIDDGSDEAYERYRDERLFG